MTILHLQLDTLHQVSDSQIFTASSLSLNLPQPPKHFFRHGWQSWTLTTWLDPSEPPYPISSPKFRAKDEDPAYALAKNHVSAWVGAVELGDDDILLIGALDLSGRVELDGTTLKAFYEDGHESQWAFIRGKEDNVFAKYTALLETKFGKTRFDKAPRVWCSWYSLYKWINEHIIVNALHALGDLPFDVFQLDDGWQVTHGDWEPTKKFPSGMAELANKIKATGRTAGLWLAPFMVTKLSSIFRDHPDWLLKDENGQPVPVGLTWEGVPYALDVSHPEVLAWLEQLIRKVRSWGYDYLKLDFLYAGAIPGKRYQDIPREVAYRNAMQVMREAAGDAYILACGAPVIPSLGLCDGIRVGPDVSPYWMNKPLSVWLNNPNDPCTQNSIRTSFHRLWLKPLVNIDPDVMFFRSKFNWLKPDEKQLLLDLGTISGFKATSDLLQWMNRQELDALRSYLETDVNIRKISRYKYQLNDREVDFSASMPISEHHNVPIWFAQNLGLLKIARRQVLPAILESLKHNNKKMWLFYPLATSISTFAAILNSL
ncbi:MAG: glycoside hydrolase family 36 protein [Chloroflexota bacterium]